MTDTNSPNVPNQTENPSANIQSPSSADSSVALPEATDRTIEDRDRITGESATEEKTAVSENEQNENTTDEEVSSSTVSTSDRVVKGIFMTMTVLPLLFIVFTILTLTCFCLSFQSCSRSFDARLEQADVAEHVWMLVRIMAAR